MTESPLQSGVEVLALGARVGRGLPTKGDKVRGFGGVTQGCAPRSRLVYIKWSRSVLSAELGIVSCVGVGIG